MHKIFMPLAALSLFTAPQAIAQDLPLGNIYSQHLPVADKQVYYDLVDAMGDFKEVCTIIYKTTVKNPDKTISQQDIDWPKGYESFTDRHSKRIGSLSIDVNIDFKATHQMSVSVEEWDSYRVVSRTQQKTVPATLCEFTMTANTNENIDSFFKLGFMSSRALGLDNISSNMTQYAHERLNYDCENGQVRKLVFFQSQKGRSYTLSLRFTQDPIDDTATLPQCQTRIAKQIIAAGGFQILNTGHVIGLNGETIGRLSANGEIIDAHGKIIGRVNVDFQNAR